MNGGWAGVGLAASMAVGLAVAASYGVVVATSSSTFCGSCHVMKSYHSSWSESTHRKVACVDCHIPPGLGPEMRKKLEGLAMVASTLTGRADTHISARVGDEVCLQCHERRLLVGQEWYGDVLFDHRPHLTELRRGMQLTCSSCHSQIVQGSHIKVTSTSCVVCHFMNREPDAPQGECATCHQVDGLVAERDGMRFDHSRAIEMGIDCDACHEAVTMGAGAVPKERCLTCHNQLERLKEFDNTPLVLEAHVNRNNALCSDCHQQLEHVAERRRAWDPKLCGGCHQPRHSPQLALYTGLAVDASGAEASPMYRAGVRCEACHFERPGMVANPADEVSCLQCHPLGIERLFGWWREALVERQATARQLHDATAAALGPAAVPALAEAHHEIDLVERGGGVHNLLLAMSLLDSAIERIGLAREEGGLAPFPPPWPQEVTPSACLRCHRGTESRATESFGRTFGHAVHVVSRDLACESCHSSHEARRDQGSRPLLFAEPGCHDCHHEQIEVRQCASCHEDRHRAQFADSGCADCHAADFWIPAADFDHSRTAYPLTGKHVDVPCAECHLEESFGEALVVRYRDLAHQRCEDCHDDPHAAPLGPSCDGCHVTADWKQVEPEALDHEKTRYPLRGRHAQLDCADCHPAGQPTRTERFAACSDCHRDEHLGQLAQRDDGAACEPCHSVAAFLPTLYSPDDHQASGFPLRGAHLAVPCDRCHGAVSTRELAALVPAATPALHPEVPEATTQFRFAATSCESCHRDPHAGATDAFMDGRGCEVCHDEGSWTQIDFDHRLDAFALEGRHLEVPCADCHPRLPEGSEQCVQLRGVPTSCAGCHDNPHAAETVSGSRTGRCERCHDAESWRTDSFDHRRDTRFPLVAAHEDVACGSCHPDARYDRAPSLCRDCHQDPHRGELGLACDRCHTPHTWSYNVEALTTHAATLFPLDGAHSTLDCSGCHDPASPAEFASTPTDCAACHADQYRSATRPDHQLLALPTDCALCHDSRSWIGARIDSSVQLDHDALFALDGAHDALDCQACHAASYTGTERECIGCHRDDFATATSPDHRSAGFPYDCLVCHSTQSWQGAIWSHQEIYPLEGAHRGLDCDVCHAATFAGTPTDCYSCHGDDFAATVDPDHRAAGFDTDCSTCHTQRRWDQVRFDHAGEWPLTGAHRRLECSDCHGDGSVALSTDCYSCHRRDYRRVQDPNHRSAGFGTDCQQCHQTTEWTDARLDHELVYPLRGAHRTLECTDCHAEGYTGTPRDCVGCHRDDYDGVADPNHRDAAFSTDCWTCHGNDSWLGADVDHPSTFPLGGGHLGLACADCHADGYAGTPTECSSCHRDDYDGTRDPDHRGAGLSLDCTLCHTNDGWLGAQFEHASSFPMTGGHAGLGCAACHADGYAGTPETCESCHRDDYDGSRQPDHRAVGLATGCAGCHTTESWRGSTFDHTTSYPLTGAHAVTTCVACHQGVTTGTPRDCETCHVSDFETTTEPDHQDAGFPRDCSLCHGTHRWQGAVLLHDAYFPLTGDHATASCRACHGDGFAGTPRECAACHLSEYQETGNPDHEGAGLSLQCEQCHSTSGWAGAVFAEHDALYFPIYDGTHASLWGSCRTCHRVPSDYQYFSCTTCHSHRSYRMDRVHKQVPGYVYSDGACYSCHPTGEVP